MRRLVCGLVVLVLFPAASITALPSQPREPVGIDGYRRAETMVYSEQGSSGEVSSLLDRVRRGLRSETDGALRAYWVARTHLLQATHYNQNGDSRAAQRQGELGFTAIQEALDRGGEFSDGLRVQADLHAQMMFARGMFYMARYGGEAREQALRAMELDPTNISAQITVAGFYLNAPRMAGGNTAEGVAILESALLRNPDSESQRFLILGLLTETYLDAGDESRAERYLQQAATIYPASPWIAELRSRAASS